MAKLSDQLRGWPLLIISGHFNVLELYSGSIPATGSTAATGTRLAVMTLGWAWGAEAYTAGALLSFQNPVRDNIIPEVTGTVGYVRLRSVPKQYNPGGGPPIQPSLAQINAYTSTHSAYLTAGLAGSGAEMEFTTLQVTVGVPVTLSELGTLVIRGE